MRRPPLETAAEVAARYDRLAAAYDWMEGPIDYLFFRHWRPRAWGFVRGPQVLEVGVGTGKNFSYYPPGLQITGVDISSRMLARARQRAARLKLTVVLEVMDAGALAFPDHTFDSAIATCVFCSVPDPVAGLQEMARVVKPEGRIVLLEHMRSDMPWMGWLMDRLDVLTSRFGPHISRRTMENVRRAGLSLERVETLMHGGMVRLIVARPPEKGQGV